MVVVIYQGVSGVPAYWEGLVSPGLTGGTGQVAVVIYQGVSGIPCIGFVSCHQVLQGVPGKWLW